MTAARDDQSLIQSLFPQGACYHWREQLIWLHALSDGMIALACLAAPIIVLGVLQSRKQALIHNWAFGVIALLFAMVGIVHGLEVAAIWWPVHFASGLAKLLTAALAVVSALILIPFAPVLLNRFRDRA